MHPEKSTTQRREREFLVQLQVLRNQEHRERDNTPPPPCRRGPWQLTRSIIPFPVWNFPVCARTGERRVPFR